MITNFSYKSGSAVFRLNHNNCNISCELYSELLQQNNSEYNFTCKLKNKKSNSYSNMNDDINYIIQNHNNIIDIDFNVGNYEKILNNKLINFLDNYNIPLYLDIYLNDHFNFRKKIQLIKNNDKIIWKVI